MIELRDIYNVKYLNSAEFSGSLSTAITEIGTAFRVLVITDPAVEVASDLTTPVNIRVVLEGDGYFDIAEGATLTLNNFEGSIDKKLYTGPGKLVIKNAPYVKLTWYKGSFGSATSITENLDNSEVFVDVANASFFGPAPYPVSVDSEIMLVTAVTGNTLTVERAYDGTTAATHTIGATISPVITTAMRDGIEDSLNSVDSAEFIVPNGQWTTLVNWTLPDGSIISGSGAQNLAIPGLRATNTKRIVLNSASNVTPLDAALGSTFYYTGDIGENTTINATNVVDSNIVKVFIPSTTTNRQVTFGTNFSAPGTKVFNTGYIAGTWVFEFQAIESTLVMTGPPVHSTTGATGAGATVQYRYTSGTSVQMIPNVAYLVDNASLVTLTLPVNANYGDRAIIKGMNTGGWVLAQNSGQTVVDTEGGVAGTNKTTTGTGGSIESTDGYDCLELVCISSNTWSTVVIKGNLTIV